MTNASGNQSRKAVPLAGGGGLEQESTEQVVCVRREKRGNSNQVNADRLRKERPEGGNAQEFGRLRDMFNVKRRALV